MNAPATFGTLQDPAPRHDRVIWADLHATKARKLVPNSRYRSAAAKMAASTFRALDPIEQAPVILIGACRYMDRKTGQKLAAIAGRHCSLVKRGLKLREMMAEYGVAAQFRKLHGSAISPYAEAPVLRISGHQGIKSSALAQAIPDDAPAQIEWLKTINAWIDHITYRRDEDWIDGILPWLISSLGVLYRERPLPLIDITVVADLWLAQPARFDRSWTYRHATGVARRWHEEIALHPVDLQRRFRRYPPDLATLDDEFDYGQLPLGLIVAGHLFTALTSPRALLEEGQAMHHCVGSYADDVRVGRSRIYSVWFEDRRVATVEIELIGSTRYRPVQLRGPRNAEVAVGTHAAAVAFVRALNAPTFLRDAGSGL